MVEAIHRHYNTTFRHRAGIQMGDAKLAERRHRHNIKVARQKFLNMPDFGHYDTWLIDLLQMYVERNSGKLLFPEWVNVSDYVDPEESFVVVPLHSDLLQAKLEEHVANLKEKNARWVPDLSADQKFLCEAMGSALPFTPVIGEPEYKWFKLGPKRHKNASKEKEERTSLVPLVQRRNVRHAGLLDTQKLSN